MVLPRYFSPRTGGEPHDASAGIAHVIDTFTLTFGRSFAQWIVGLDTVGSLAVRRLEPFEKLSTSVRSQIAFHEVSGGARRAIGLDTLFVFDMRLLEQAPDCPGVNDPVFLYGTLIGPLVPGSGETAPRVQRVEGQLTVTRGDLLAGLVGGAGWAFRCSDASGGRMARTLSLLIGADHNDAVRAGRGAVLIYPLLGIDAEIHDIAPGNEDVVSRILYDLLFAWWSDAARDAPPALREAESLPVPSRPQHEERLKRDGFEIKRDTAVRPRPGWAGVLPGFLGGEERRKLPPEAGIDEFLDLAAEALFHEHQWPSPSVVALYHRVESVTRGSSLTLRTDRLPPPSPPPPASRPPPAWVQSFISAHKQSPRPRLTPGPDDPAAPRALTPLETAVAAKTVEVMQYLEGKFDDDEPPPRKPRGSP